MALGKNRVDTVLLVAIIIALLFGVIMVYSASSILAFQDYGDTAYFFKRQILWAIVGLVVMAITANLHYRIWKNWAGWLLAITMILLCSVFLFSRGAVNGAHRWVTFGGQTFQPSELAKFTLIIYISAWLCKQKAEIASIRKTFLPFIGILVVISVLMLLEPDFGTLSIMLAAAGAIYIVAGMTWKQFSLGVIVGVLALTAILAVPYRRARIESYFNPSTNTTTSYQVKNIAIAVGSGNWFGLGFGASKQKLLFLPEPHTDSIFAVITEELGFVIATLLIGLFVFILYRGYRIAVRTQDDFGRYIAVGIITWIGFQTFINLASMLKIVPLVGVPLPLISFGGTSLIIVLGALGVLLNISRYADGSEQTTLRLPRRQKVGRVG